MNFARMRYVALLVTALVIMAGCDDNDDTASPCPRDDLSSPALVSLVPGLTVYGVDETVVLLLLAQSASNLDTFSCELLYDGAVLQFVGGEEGAFMDGDGAETSFQVNPVAEGRVSVSLSRLGRCPGVSGSDVVATLEFLTVGQGDAGLRFTGAGLADPRGYALPSVWNAAVVRVEP